MAKMGRPRLPRGTKKAATFNVRVSTAERRLLDAAAKKAGVKLGTWARTTLLAAAGEP